MDPTRGTKSSKAIRVDITLNTRVNARSKRKESFTQPPGLTLAARSATLISVTLSRAQNIQKMAHAVACTRLTCLPISSRTARAGKHVSCATSSRDEEVDKPAEVRVRLPWTGDIGPREIKLLADAFSDPKLLSSVPTIGGYMLRNGTAALRHQASILRGGPGGKVGGGSATYPSSWSGPFAFANELIAGFLEAVSASNELERYRSRTRGEGEEEALRRVGEYVRGLRGLMAVGIAPMPGTKVQSIEIDGRSAVWLTPDGKSWDDPDAPRRTVMWMHGGAFILCSTNTHARLLSSLGIAAGAKVLSVEYPLAPDEGRYEEMLSHVVEAYQWLTNPSGGGVDPGSIVVGGDSAGGHLAVGLVQRLISSEVAKGPAGVVLMSPWLDPGRDDPATEDAWNSARDTSCCYLRGVKDSLKVVHDLVFERVMEEEEENELAFSYLPPRNMLRRELWDGERASRCPPMLVQYGGAEVLAAESRNFVRIASESGIEVTSQEFKDLPHVFQVFDALEAEGERAIQSAGAFVSDVCKSS